MNYKRGFTLVEILFVVIIAAGILAFAVPAYKRSQEYSEYQAATGFLMAIGNAVQTARLEAGTFPQGSEKEIVGNEQESDSEQLKSKTLSQYLAGATGNARDTLFVKALFAYGYLTPFATATGYQFYAVKSNASSVCSSVCKVTGAVACMCKDGTTDDCYYGAVYLSDGTIVRKPKDSSKCS